MAAVIVKWVKKTAASHQARDLPGGPGKDAATCVGGAGGRTRVSRHRAGNRLAALTRSSVAPNTCAATSKFVSGYSGLYCRFSSSTSRLMASRRARIWTGDSRGEADVVGSAREADRWQRRFARERQSSDEAL